MNLVPVLHYTAMVDVEAGRFTVGVFQDVPWATKGIAALVQAGLPPASLTILAKDTPDATALLDVAGNHSGPSGGCRREADDPPRSDGGCAARERSATSARSVWRARCAASAQAHDGRIFEALVARGGILVAVHSEPRAADALAVMFSYGGGNAAIGAWTGRV